MYEGLDAPPIKDDWMAGETAAAMDDWFMALPKDQWMVLRVPSDALKDADEEMYDFALQLFQNFADEIIIYNQSSAVIVLTDKLRVYVKMNHLEEEFNFYLNLTKMLCREISHKLKGL